MSVRIILDVSALHAYGTVSGAIAIGELAYMVDDAAGGQIGIPAGAYLAAFADAEDHCREELSRVLADIRLAVDDRDDPAQSAFALLPLELDNLADAGELERRWPGQGHAIVEALRYGAALATFHPPKQALPGVSVIDLGMDWDGIGEGWTAN